MVITKRLNLDNVFLFLFLVVFPFGQIVRVGILQPIDVVVGLGALIAILKKFEKPEVFRYFENFLFMAAFSWIFSAFFFRQVEVLYGFLYLARLAAYSYFFVYVWNFVRKRELDRRLLIDSLLGVSVVSAIFGWIQYFSFPALRAFMIWGWDEHLYRLVGTFLDPSFLGIIIVFGFLITIYRYIVNGRKKYVVLGGFLLISLAFTYSRASYLALIVGAGALFFSLKKLKYFLILVFSLLILILLLPISSNRVLSFMRGFSALARIENYVETINVFKTSPVFGVGYNNLCLAKAGKTGFMNFASHACSGSDSSLLFILATTGVVGFVVFVGLVWGIYQSLRSSPKFLLLNSSFFALLIHSLFSNSLVYPWVLGYVLIILAVSLGSEVKS